MRTVDVAVLVGQAVAAVAYDRLDAAGKVRGAILMLSGICCTVAMRSLLQARFRSEGESPCCVVFCRGFLRGAWSFCISTSRLSFLRRTCIFRIAATCFWQPANALACAQRLAILDGIEEPIRRDAEWNSVLACGNTREKAAAPGDVHAVVRAGQTHLSERRSQHHDHAAGHLAVAATLRTPALHDEHGPCGGKL